MEGYGIVKHLTQAQVDAGEGNALVGVRIAIIDGTTKVPTGVVYESGAAGSAPTPLVTGANINTVLQSAGGAGWEKAQAGSANYVITRPASGASLDLHIETGGTLAAMLPANWPIPASGVDQLRIRNFSATAQTFSATGYSGIVTADGNVATSGSYSIPVDMAVHITIDEDGWVQVAPMGQEVSQAELDAALAGKSDASHTHSISNVTSLQTSLDAKVTKTAGTGVYAGTLPSRSNAPTTITTTQSYTTSPATITVSSSLVGVVVGDRWANNGEFITITAIDRVAGTVTVTGQTFFHSAGTETLQAIGTGTQDPLYQVLAKKDVGLDNVDNTADSAKPVSTAATAALALKAPVKQPVPTYSASATYAVGDQVIEANVMYKCKTAITAGEAFAIAKWDIVGSAVVVNNTLTSTSTTEALSAAQGKALKDTADTLATTVAGKQDALVSGTDIKTVNGASLLGAGNISIAGDLPGGTPTTLTDEGLVAGNASIDRTTVPGQTILKYTTAGATTFTPPIGVTSVRVLSVGGGGGGGPGTAGQNYGAGGAGGIVRTDAALAVSGSTAVTVGAGGSGGVNPTAGGTSTIGVVSATGGNPPSPVGSRTGGSNADFTGETGATENYTGGGGAGAGENGGVNGASEGGDGVSNDIVGTATFYGGGGGSVKGAVGKPGGAGGGGAGLNATATSAQNGVANTGGGGGGAPTDGGGAGGSGIVVIRFATQSRSYTALTSYADNAAAIAGGKLIGQFFKLTSTGAVTQVV